MAEETNGSDVNEMFQKMGEKLGWFKHKNFDEAKHMVTLDAQKKTKIKKENVETGFGDLKSKGKKTDKLKLKKKKPKVTEDVTSKQRSKSETTVKQKLPRSKAQSFQLLLSSDSDSSLTDMPKLQGKSRIGKAVLAVSSDSDDDVATTATAKNYSGECIIMESFVDSVEGFSPQNMVCPQFEPILDIKPGRKSDIDCNETVLRKKVSLASCTLDLDNLGEPLVESTRIHRRSSITYKQIMDDFDSPSDDRIVAENAKKSEQYHLKEADELFDLATSVCDETNYITAIEAIDDTLNSSNEIRKLKELLGDKKSSNHKSEIRSQTHTNNSESGEEVEVVDTATQTDEVATSDHDSLEQSCGVEKKIHRAYKEDTIEDSEGKMLDFDNKYRASSNIYDEDTVQDSHAGANSHSMDQVNGSPELPNPEKELSDMSRYAEDTVNELENKFASTTISECVAVNDYSKQTVCHEIESVSDDNVYTDTTGLDNKNGQETNIEDPCNSPFKKDVSVVGVKKDILETFDDMNNEYGEVADDEADSAENDRNSEANESVYEVNDVGTQTEELDNVERKPTLADEVQRETGQTHSDVEVESNMDELNEIEQNECAFGDRNENVNKNDKDFVGKKKLVEVISDESDISERTQDDIAESTNDSSDSSDAISATFANLAKKSVNKKQMKDIKQKKADVAEESWRSSRRYSSDSSSDGDLEAFFQKLKKPEQKKSSDSSSPMSMDDFIVEDDDMTSESDDSGFHLRETQELENREDQSPKLHVAQAHDDYDDDDDDDDDDESDDFSSQIYPPSVTKHKKKKHAQGKKQSNVSWSFSLDSEEETGTINSKLLKKPKGDIKSKDKKLTKDFKKNTKRNIDIDLSSDSDVELFNIDSLKTDSDRKKKLDSDGNDAMNGNSKKTGKVGPLNSLSGSVGDEEPLFKTPNPLRRKKTEENKENIFRTPTSVKRRVPKTPESTSKPVYISLSDTDSDAEDSSDFVVSVSDSSTSSKTNGTPPVPLSMKNITTPSRTPLSLKSWSTPMSAKPYPTCTFLKSLSNTTDDSRRHPEARKFVNNFKKYKEELSSHLFKLYNKTIFEDKLPSNLPVIWNKRLLRTAGYCVYKKNSHDATDRSTRIELSVKVCDNAERVRDTLIHEMCHAAVWMLNGVNSGHGPHWKYWARHATRVHPELPAVSVCHSYSINTKFTYRCKCCGYSIGRHSKSLDVKKKVCSHCRGEFELIQNSQPTTPTSAVRSTSSTPKLPNKFALFVKDNYNSVKKQNQSLKHGDVMKELSKLFAESKITS